MDKEKTLHNLADRIQHLPYRDKKELDTFITDTQKAITDLFTDSSRYLDILNAIQFTPTSFYSTEEEYEKSWVEGIKSTLILLNEMVTDPIINGETINISKLPEIEEDKDQIVLPKNNDDELLDSFRSHIIEEEPKEKEFETEKVLTDIEEEKNKKDTKKEEVIDDFLDDLLTESIKAEPSSFTINDIPLDSTYSEPKPTESPEEPPEEPEDKAPEQNHVTTEAPSAVNNESVVQFLKNVNEIKDSFIKKIKRNSEQISQMLQQKKDIKASELLDQTKMEEPINQTDMVELEENSTLEKTSEKEKIAETKAMIIEDDKIEKTENETLHENLTLASDAVKKDDQVIQEEPELQEEVDTLVNEPIEETIEEENKLAEPEITDEEVEQEIKERIAQIDSIESEKEEEHPTNYNISNRVFLLSSKDEKLNNLVINTLGKVGVGVIQLRDEKNISKTLKQKREEYYDIHFTVVILTSDNWVYPKEGKPTDASIQTDQGIIFEMGYWIGHLGRDRVIVLYQEKHSFRRPTGFFEVLYLPIDKDGQWKLELAQRLKAHNFRVYTQRLEQDGI